MAAEVTVWPRKERAGWAKTHLARLTPQKAISLENVENRGPVGEVSGEIWTSHQNVVEIDKNKQKTAEEMVHEPLKRLSSVAETKRHLSEFKEAERSDDGCFGNIGGGNLIVAFD